MVIQSVYVKYNNDFQSLNISFISGSIKLKNEQ